MAIPLEPVIQRRSSAFASEQFVESDLVADLADTVLSRYDEFRDIEEAVRESELLIAYVWDAKPYDPSEERTHDTIAKVSKLGPLPRSLARRHLAIQFRWWWWDHMDLRQREAVLYHEFSHVQVWHDEKSGELKIRLRDHDIEEFNAVMRRFGPIIPGRQEFLDQYEAWQQAQAAAGRAPRPLRSVQQLADDVAKLPPDQQAAVQAVVDARVGLDRVEYSDDGPADEEPPAPESETTTTIRIAGGSELPLDLEHPSEEVQRGARRLIREALDVSEPCPFPACDQLADHEGEHTPPAGGK